MASTPTLPNSYGTGLKGWNKFGCCSVYKPKCTWGLETSTKRPLRGAAFPRECAGGPFSCGDIRLSLYELRAPAQLNAASLQPSHPVVRQAAGALLGDTTFRWHVTSFRRHVPHRECEAGSEFCNFRVGLVQVLDASACRGWRGEGGWTRPFARAAVSELQLHTQKTRGMRAGRGSQRTEGWITAPTSQIAAQDVRDASGARGCSAPGAVLVIGARG